MLMFFLITFAVIVAIMIGAAIVLATLGMIASGWDYESGWEFFGGMLMLAAEVALLITGMYAAGLFKEKPIGPSNTPAATMPAEAIK